MKVPFNTSGSRGLLYLLLGSFSCLYLESFILPRTPIYQGDTVTIFLSEATRMLEGQALYRDFFEFMFPGTQLVYLFLFKLLGVRAWIPSLMFILLGVGLVWVGAVISRGLMSGKLVFLPSILFLGFAYSTEPDATHHWFSSLAALAALALMIEKRSLPRIAGAGALCGLATLFTQSRGPAAVLALAVFLLWECLTKKQGWRKLVKSEFCLFAGFAAAALPLLTYFAFQTGLRHFAECTFVFLMRYWNKWFWGTPHVYMAEPPIYPFWVELPALGIWLFIHALLPLVYLLFLVRYVREKRAHPEEPWDRLMLVTIVGLCLFLGIAFSPTWMRLCSVSLPALIVFVWLIKSSRVLTSLVWAAGLLALVVQPALVQTGWHGYLDSPTGRAAFLDPGRYEKYRWVLDRTRAGDFFFQADDCDMYFPLGLRNPSQIYFVTASDFTRPEQVQNVVESLERERVRFVAWSVWLDVPRGESLEGDHLAPLRAYLHAHYQVVKNFTDPDFGVAWERKGPPIGGQEKGQALLRATGKQPWKTTK